MKPDIIRIAFIISQLWRANSIASEKALSCVYVAFQFKISMQIRLFKNLRTGINIIIQGYRSSDLACKQN